MSLLLNVVIHKLTWNTKDRVTDHRSGLTVVGLQSVMDGRNLQPFIDDAKTRHERDRLESLLEDISEQ